MMKWKKKKKNWDKYMYFAKGRQYMMKKIFSYVSFYLVIVTIR